MNIFNTRTYQLHNQHNKHAIKFNPDTIRVFPYLTKREIKLFSQH